MHLLAFVGATGEHRTGMSLFCRATGEPRAGACLPSLVGQWESTGLVTLASTIKVEGEYKNSACQHFQPQREFQHTPAPLADALVLANESPSHIV